jgi:hypothetical protein
VKKFLEFLYMGDYFDNRSPGMETANQNKDEEEEHIYGMSYSKSSFMKAAKRRVISSSSSSSSANLKSSYQNVAPTGEDGPLLLNAKLYIMADRYDVQPLKVLAKTKYEQVIGNGWNHPGFAASLKILYDETLETDRLMKDIAIKTAGQNAKVLVDRGEFANLLKSNGEIAFDILKSSMGVSMEDCPWGGVEHASWVSRQGSGYYCSSCGNGYS